MKLKSPWVIGGVVAAVSMVACCGIGGIVAMSWNRVVNPERALIVDYLKKNANDPRSVEIVEWVESTPRKFYGKSYTRVVVKVRSRNKFGALDVRVRELDVEDGRVTPSTLDMISGD